MKISRTLLGLLTLGLAVNVVQAYPLDGYQTTGIRRLEAGHLAALGQLRGPFQPAGALLPTEYVQLRLTDHPDLDVPRPDGDFTRQVLALFSNERERYGIAVLDLSNPDQPRYAEYRGNRRQNVASIGKIVVALALFQALADIYPNNIEARKQILRETLVTADNYITSDHHKVHLWDSQTRTVSHRPLRIGDQASLWEYLDWMLSASSNAAAAMVMKHAMLLVQFGKNYPVSQSIADRLFSETDRGKLGDLFDKTFHHPVTRNGLDLRQLRQGSFFTKYGKRQMPGSESYGTARELVRYLLRLEQGRLVDAFSSREIKRLLYATERRIRYASSPALFDAAVYFKSGSFYKCRPESHFVCKKYRGNVRNYMNSIAIIESPVGKPRLHYLVGLISNVLYKNSAVDHQTLATRIHRLIEAAHNSEPAPQDNLPARLPIGENLIGYEQRRTERLLIARIQAELIKLGYKIGTVDGILGNSTSAAIEHFQQQHELEVDGKISEALLNLLKETTQALQLPTDAELLDHLMGQ